MHHDFHFVLQKNQKEEINNIAKKLKMSKSEVVIYIIKIMRPCLERFFYNGIKDNNSEYQRFKATAHMHVILDEKSYKIVKHITDNLYIFSMAITLRKILQIFIKLTNKVEIGKVIEKLKKIRLRHLRSMIDIKNLKKNIKIRQLSKIHNKIREKKMYKLVFNKYFEVIYIDFST